MQCPSKVLSHGSTLVEQCPAHLDLCRIYLREEATNTQPWHTPTRSCKEPVSKYVAKLTRHHYQCRFGWLLYLKLTSSFTSACANNSFIAQVYAHFPRCTVKCSSRRDWLHSQATEVYHPTKEARKQYTVSDPAAITARS